MSSTQTHDSRVVKTVRNLKNERRPESASQSSKVLKLATNNFKHPDSIPYLQAYTQAHKDVSHSDTMLQDAISPI